MLGEIIHEPGSILQKKLSRKGSPIRNKKTKRFAHVIVFAGKVQNAHATRGLTIGFAAHNLMKADTASKSDPYFRVLRNNTVVYGDRNNYFKNTLDPKWPPFTIDTQLLTNNDPLAEITIEVWDWDKDDKSGDDFLGKVVTNIEHLKQKPTGLELVNPQNKSKKKTKKKPFPFGTLDVTTYQSASTFVDYLQGGVDMSMMCAIDFTASNQHPSDPKSLHCIQDQTTGEPVVSAYQHAIRIIGNIVSIYDHDQMYPVWGFGLNVPSQSANALHSFNLNFSPDNPEVHGIHGVEQTYVNAVNAVMTNSIILSGPTFFSPILQKAGFIAGEAHKQYMIKKSKNVSTKPTHFILLILTDGNIDDMKATRETIVKISNTNVPLSVIIVGVGNEDFTKMDILDADDEPLKDADGNVAMRDIVQFVPFNKISEANDLSLLAKETLAEIPAQFMSYVKAHNIEPRAKAKPKYNAAEYDAKDTAEAEAKELEDQIDYNIQADPWINAPVPPGWTREYTEDGKPYYVQDSTQTTQWEHPGALVFLKKLKEKEEADKAVSSDTQATNAFGNFGDNMVDWAAFD
eukprot:121970_1